METYILSFRDSYFRTHEIEITESSNDAAIDTAKSCAMNVATKWMDSLPLLTIKSTVLVHWWLFDEQNKIVAEDFIDYEVKKRS